MPSLINVKKLQSHQTGKRTFLICSLILLCMGLCTIASAQFLKNLSPFKPYLFYFGFLLAFSSTLGTFLYQSKVKIVDPVESLKYQKFVFILLAVLLVFGLAVRIYNNTELPYGIDNDEYIGSDIGRFFSGDVVDEFWKNIGGYNLIHILTVAPFSLVFGNNIFAIRTASAVYATLTVLFIFLICQKLRFPTLGLVTVFLLMVSKPFIAIARMDTVLNSGVFPFGAMFCLLYAAESNSVKKSAVFATFAVFLSFIAVNLYYVFFTLPFVLVVVAGRYIIFSRIPPLRKLVVFLCICCVALVCAPRLKQVVQMKYASTMTAITTPILDGPKLSWGLDRVLQNTFTSGTYSGDDIYFNTQGPYFGSVLTVLFITGLGLLFFYRWLGFYTLCLLVLPIIPAVISSSTLPRVYHLSAIAFMLISAMPIAYGATLGVELLSKYKKVATTSILGILFIMLAIFGAFQIKDYFEFPPPIRANSDGLKDREVIEMVRDTVSQNRLVFILYQRNAQNHFNGYIRVNHLKFAQSYNLFEKMEDRVYRYSYDEYYKGKVSLKRTDTDIMVEKTPTPENQQLLRELAACLPQEDTIVGEYFYKFRLGGVNKCVTPEGL